MHELIKSDAYLQSPGGRSCKRLASRSDELRIEIARTLLRLNQLRAHTLKLLPRRLKFRQLRCRGLQLCTSRRGTRPKFEDLLL